MYINMSEVCALRSTLVLFTGRTTRPTHPFVSGKVEKATSYKMSQNKSAVVYLQNQTGSPLDVNIRTAVCILYCIFCSSIYVISLHKNNKVSQQYDCSRFHDYIVFINKNYCNVVVVSVLLFF